MRAFSVVPFALVGGFLAGHGFVLTADMLPMLAAIIIGFLALTATNLLSEED